MKANEIWQAALGELQLEMTRATFDTWLRDAKLVAYEDGTFVIGVRNGYAKDWLENRLTSTIRRVLTRLADRTVTIRFAVWEGAPKQPPPAALNRIPLQASGVAQTKDTISFPSNPLNPRYTFDLFVVGSSNRLAYAAALAVVEKPADYYNPLFIYGGVGLGKTHLLQAIGHACRTHNLRALYVPAETFTNELIEAIRNYTTDCFRETYRTADVLLIDDVHFIAGKEATQEEFFHTFNALHGSGSQIVISSDRRPTAIATLEERLRSRFEWGLMVDVSPPELETRLAILRRKAEAQGAGVPDEVLYAIAERVQMNIRELEGTLNKVLMLSNVGGKPLTPELVDVALADLRPSRSEIDGDQIKAAVARYYGLGQDELCGPSRKRRISRPRQLAMYLMRQETDKSLSQIGTALGGRDHTTVIHGCNRINSLIEENETLRRELLAIREQLHRGELPANMPRTTREH
ncbi:MAG: chromosomal replication initiator protein DnaA [Anaerolineae bacterium]|jgi:chromosomal replication initiator protein